VSTRSRPQLLAHSRPARLPMRPGRTRCGRTTSTCAPGTANLFVAVEPKSGPPHRLGHRTPWQARFCRLHARTCCCSACTDMPGGSTWWWTTWIPTFVGCFEDVLGVAGGSPAAAPGRLPPHAQARKLAQYRRNRGSLLSLASACNGAYRTMTPCATRFAPGSGVETTSAAPSSGPFRRQDADRKLSGHYVFEINGLMN